MNKKTTLTTNKPSSKLKLNLIYKVETMLPHNMTDNELLNINSDCALTIELQKRLTEALDKVESIRQFINENHITKPYIDKDDKSHTIDSAIYYIKNELEHLADESEEMYNKLEKAMKYANIVDTCNMQNEDDERNFLDFIEDLL